MSFTKAEIQSIVREEIKKQMSQGSGSSQGFLRIGDEAPDFTADTSTGNITWHDYIKGKWGILFSHPRDFTPVCTTEISKVAQLKNLWEKKNCVVAVVSVDDVASHKEWIKEIEKVKRCKITFPIIGDESKKVSSAYGMLDESNTDAMPQTVRSVFFIGPDKKIKLIMTYPASTGRNFDEIIRCLDSLQLAVSHKVATPADWKIGSDCCLLPTLTDDEAKTYKDMKVVSASCKLRMVPCPIGGGKKDKKKGGGDKGGSKKDKKAAADEKAAKAAAKKLKAVIKEGGKKGQDVEGMCAMGNKAASVNLMEPEGKLDYMFEALTAMNKEVDPEGDDRKGGAGAIPKLIVSAGETELSALMHVPEAGKSIINIEEWSKFVFGFLNITPVKTKDPCVLSVNYKSDPDADRFPLKDRDTYLAKCFEYLRDHELICAEDSDDEDYSGAANLGAHTDGADY